jgi:hypothetical protein
VADEVDEDQCDLFDRGRGVDSRVFRDPNDPDYDPIADDPFPEELE